MFDLQKIALVAGSLLLGSSVMLMWDRRQRTGNKTKNRKGERSIEELANSLKQAWAAHHTR
jgi:hypothetical protein